MFSAGYVILQIRQGLFVSNSDIKLAIQQINMLCDNSLSQTKHQKEKADIDRKLLEWKLNNV